MKIIQELKYFFQKYPNKDNLICVLTYGSIVNKRFSKNSDIDLYIVFKQFNAIDYKLLQEMKKIFNRKLDITIEYEADIDPDPNKFVSGPNDSFALSYLSSAYAIYGFNIFKTMRKSLDKKIYKMSIFRKIVEYSYRVRTFLLERDTASIQKYLARIVIDILLLKNPDADMSEFKILTKEEALNMLRYGGVFPDQREILVNAEDTQSLALLNYELLNLAKSMI